MNRFVTEAFLFTPDDDEYLWGTSSSSSSSDSDWSCDCNCTNKLESSIQNVPVLDTSLENMMIVSDIVEEKPDENITVNKDSVEEKLDENVTKNRNPDKEKPREKLVKPETPVTPAVESIHNMDTSSEKDLLQVSKVEYKKKEEKQSVMANIYGEADFIDAFGVNWAVHQELAGVLKGKLSSICDPDKASRILLWYLRHTEGHKLVADRFGERKSTAYKIVNIAIEQLASTYIDDYIKWPHPPEYQTLSKGFSDVTDGIKGAIGAIGVTHLGLTPVRKKEDYLDSRLHLTVAVQAVVDYRKKLLDVFVAKGELKDREILEKSEVPEKVDKLDKYFFLGKPSYKASKWLVPPFRVASTDAARRFNKMHETGMNVLKGAFKSLKSRFPKLNDLKTVNFDIAEKTILSACVLHNMCVDFDVKEFSMADDPGYYNEEICEINDNHNKKRLEVFNACIKHAKS